MRVRKIDFRFLSVAFVDTRQPNHQKSLQTFRCFQSRASSAVRVMNV
jgi:hypothetical protein